MNVCLVSESPQHILLQTLNDRNQVVIDKLLATEGVKDWINHCTLPKQLGNPIIEFKDADSITCLSFASLVSDDATVRQLVEAGADVTVADGRGYTALHHVCARYVSSAGFNQADRVRALIYDHGVSVNTTDRLGWTALHLAAQAGHAEAVSVLVSHPSCVISITVGPFGCTAADFARRRGR